MKLTDEQVKRIREKLEEIAAMKEASALDQLSHAENILRSNSKLAKEILNILEEAENGEDDEDFREGKW